MAGVHLIRTNRLEISYTNESKSRSLQDRFSRMHSHLLSGVINDVLTELSEQGLSINLSQLTVDLGEIAEVHLERDAPDRLRVALKEALQKKLKQYYDNELQTKPLDTEKRLTLVLESFLQLGSMPWWYKTTDLSFDHLVDKVLDEQADEWITILKRNIKQGFFVQRLVLQFSENTIKKLIQVLNPTEAEVVISTVQDIQRTHEKKSLSPIPEQSFSLKIWELAIIYLIEERGSYFNTKSFIKSILQGIAAHLNIGFAQLLIQMRESVHHLAEHHNFPQSLPHILDELYFESVERSQAEKAETEKSSLETHLFHFLETGFVRSVEVTKQDLQRELSKILSEKPSHFVSFFRGNGKDEMILKRTIHFFNDKQIRMIIIHTEPNDHEFIFQFASELDKRTKESESLLSAHSHEWHALKWGFILKILLVDRGSVFNTKMFVLHTLRLIAAHFNLHFDELLDWVLGNVKISTNTIVQGRLIPALLALQKEYLSNPEFTDNQSTPTNSTTYSSKDSSSDVLLAWLEHSISQGKSPWWADEHILKTATIDQILNQLLDSSHRQDVRLFNLFRSAKNRLVLIRKTKGSTLLKLARTIQPVESAKIQYYSELIDIVDRQNNVTQASAKMLEEEKWNIILEALLTNRGTRFNFQSFLETTLTKIASRFNLKLTILIETLLDVVELSRSSYKKEVASILSNINARVSKQELQNQEKKKELLEASILGIEKTT